MEGRVITALGHSYHPHCFICDRCGLVVSTREGGRERERDRKREREREGKDQQHKLKVIGQ